jgi:hypothetical protein
MEFEQVPNTKLLLPSLSIVGRIYLKGSYDLCSNIQVRIKGKTWKSCLLFFNIVLFPTYLND